MAQTVKNLPAGELGLIPEPGRSPGEENGNPLQYSCLQNPKDREVWQATVHGVTESDTTQRLSLTIVLITNKKQTKNLTENKRMHTPE